jgi:8-oxo-dGTP pyrophosphatase MutT (NUDIX family)
MILDQPGRATGSASLAECVERSILLTDQAIRWGEMGLRMRYFVGTHQPPLDLVTSVRAVLFRGSDVMVMTNVEGGFHVNPGGRREPGESVDGTLERELLEETGWTIRRPKFMGFIHFLHLSPRPAAYPYPHPEFLQLLFVAEAGDYCSGAQRSMEYEIASEFRSIEDAYGLLDAGQAAVLSAAVRFRSG